MELSNSEVKLSKPPFLNDKTNCIEAYELVFGRRRKKERKRKRKRKKWDASLASTEATSNGERKKKNWPLKKLGLKPPKKGDFFMPFHPLLSILLHFFFLFFYGIHKRSNPD